MRILSADKDKEQLDFSYIVGREFKMVSPFWKIIWQCLIKLNTLTRMTQQSQSRDEDLCLHKSLSVQYLL